MRLLGMDRRGFSLVELLVVMAMLGIVTTAIFSIYQTSQRTASTQDRVIDLQQNLRIALDQVARDVRMAGFMIPPDGNPITVAAQNTITIQTASATGRSARISVEQNPAAPSQSFTVTSSERADLFANGNKVRIIRPPNQSNLFTSRDLEVSTTPSGATLTITGFDAADVNTVVQPGDVVVRRSTDPAEDTDSVTFSRNARELVRTVLSFGGSSISATVAEGLVDSANADEDGLNFRYILDNGSILTTVPNAQLSDIKAVQVILTGEADSIEGSKTRQISSVINLRNR